MSFEDIVGNEKNKKLFEVIIKENKITNGYIFIGQESIGKLLFAKEFAKAILCTNKQKPCNKCKSCIEFNTFNNPDFNIINPDGNNIKIEQIRELVKKAYEKPIVSNRKVYIINNSNLMTKEAQNSLLKTLEEPPEYITIILISSNENMFLPTIKSRCTKILFNKLSDEEIKLVLKKEYNYTNIPEVIFDVAKGSIKKVVELKDKQQQYENIKKIFFNLEKINIIDLINSKEDIFKDKEQSITLLEHINLIFFDKIKINAKYLKCIKIVEDTKDRLKSNSNFDMSIDNFMLNIWEEING
ncbi:MAG: DNA polymerase III subunit [Clostridia bacterium]|nr:DNA polymerase III subunit [Clostridia bacterium]